MRQKVGTLFLLFSCLTLLTIAAFAFWPQIVFYQFTGRFYPIRRIESLQGSVGVAGWNDSELMLADGRKVKLPGFRKLPLKSEGLFAATKQGVEIAPDGRIFGLVRIHHWCGNDPVQEHVARVDISDLLLFLGEGEPIFKLPPQEEGLQPPGGTFSRFGWTVDEFLQFEFWQKLRQQGHDSQK